MTLEQNKELVHRVWNQDPQAVREAFEHGGYYLVFHAICTCGRYPMFGEAFLPDIRKFKGNMFRLIGVPIDTCVTAAEYSILERTYQGNDEQVRGLLDTRFLDGVITEPLQRASTLIRTDEQSTVPLHAEKTE